MTNEEIAEVLLKNYLEDNPEPTKEIKRQLLAQEMQIRVNNIYVLELRHRVNKRLGNEDQLKPIEAELETNHKYLDALRTEVKSLE